ncbi:MAG: adenylate/guanylate cyclase domain-containing protein [SAR324 cluster bacterium]|nr:adenylate/guanylate cyclase domain-containing protein [SAR324 cluster bacterium]
METSGAERRLAAIFVADVAGYSRLMGDDPEATVQTLTDCRADFASHIGNHRGRVVNAPGDSILAEFGSVLDAVSCAMDIQQVLAEKNSVLPEQRRMRFRIGVTLGDVLVKDGALYGDGVNIAARLEALAEPGGVCISGKAYDEVASRLPLHFDFLGEREVKNIANPVRTYRVRSRDAAAMDAEPISAPAGEGAQPRGGSATEHRSGQAQQAPGMPSIAVLAFQNMSGDPEQEYFSDGISEDIITDLSRLSGLNITARNSSFAYKGQAKDLRQVGKELGVRYVLEGSVRKAGQRVRITAQLIDTETGNHVWAGRFDRNLDDIFAIQDEITEEIVIALDVTLLRGEIRRIWGKYLKTVEARAIYRAGSTLFDSPTRELNIDSRQKFEQVRGLEPDSPVGYNGLGWTHWYDARYGWSGDRAQSLDLASGLVQEALAKDDTYPAANILLGGIYLLKGEYEQAIDAVGRAEAIAPNHSHVMAFSAMALHFSGDYKEATVKAQRAIRLSPVPPAWHVGALAMACYGQGQYDEAIGAAGEALAVDAHELEARLYKTAAHEALGQHDQAAAEAREMQRSEPGISLAAFATTQPYQDRAVLDVLLELLRKAGLPQ